MNKDVTHCETVTHKTHSGGFSPKEMSVCQVGMSNPYAEKDKFFTVDSFWKTVANILMLDAPN